MDLQSRRCQRSTGLGPEKHGELVIRFDPAAPQVRSHGDIKNFQAKGGLLSVFQPYQSTEIRLSDVYRAVVKSSVFPMLPMSGLLARAIKVSTDLICAKRSTDDSRTGADHYGIKYLTVQGLPNDFHAKD